MKWIDIPPVWLAGALGLAWGQARFAGFGLGFGGGAADFLGGLLVGAGLLIMLLAVFEMWRQRTTPVPHRVPSALVTTGIFSRSRNPIYLGDSLVLLGMILRWDAVLALPLLPLFVWVIERRFILAEEDRLTRKFPAEFIAYAQQTRRWL